MTSSEGVDVSVGWIPDVQHPHETREKRGPEEKREREQDPIQI